ncbi:unnamed protein product (macronuclear) [Paramecium tetraurelia]|uniref:Uncharacterized protein n=1 Tax=Paramecium tetraurelia TaxID=5888 RepID=A0DBM9_PARTE|nr:uncharacterized protein GSPATT00015342001 [Paramecium tetraurelia]CAK80446.1 unnamed protein product [Paramecium tetraurelia]|eukprot:XP_001447843.1 hypothetical protein (macronuclear) [Paramecium tetraurelia strain d4-2]
MSNFAEQQVVGNHHHQQCQNDNLVQTVILMEQQENFEDDFYDQAQIQSPEGIAIDVDYINDEIQEPKNSVKKIQYKKIQKYQHQNNRNRQAL